MISVMSDAGDPFARAEASAANLSKLTGAPHFDTAVVLGSGWLAAADAIGAQEAEIPLADLGGFEEPTTQGHTPSVRYLKKGNQGVLLFLGRVHMYEGHHPHTVVHGVRTAIAAGCRTVVLTNRSPLSGPLPPGVPSRFTDLTEVYSARLRALAREHDPTLAEDVYAALPGPHYETPAEIRMLRTAGADLVGMSTALEAIAARHLGAEVLAISLVTNPAAGLSDEPLDHTEVLAAAQASAARIGGLLATLLPRL